MKTKRHIYPFFITLLLFIWPVTLYAQPSETDAPIHVEADRMVSKQKEQSVIFSGNVEAKQGELLIHADEMTVFHEKDSALAENSQNNTQKIQKLHATGNVKISQGNLVATGDKMEFYSKEKKVLITGKTKVWQGNNLVTGEKIMLDLNTETTIIEPDKDGGRVKAFFYPEKK